MSILTAFEFSSKKLKHWSTLVFIAIVFISVRFLTIFMLSKRHWQFFQLLKAHVTEKLAYSIKSKRFLIIILSDLVKKDQNPFCSSFYCSSPEMTWVLDLLETERNKKESNKLGVTKFWFFQQRDWTSHSFVKKNTILIALYERVLNWPWNKNLYMLTDSKLF